MLNLINTAYAAALPTFNSQNLPTFIGDVYSFSMTVVGIAIFIQFLRAGYAYLVGGAFPGKIAEANEMMKNAIIGAILLFSSWLILNVINPDLVKNSFNFSLPRQGAPANAPPGPLSPPNP